MAERLVVIHSGTIRTFPLPPKEARIGSAPENDLVLSFPGVSRRHALLTTKRGVVELTDLGSKNGLIIKGTRVERVTLTEGESVQIGEAFIRLESVSTSEAELAFSIGSTSHGSTWSEKRNPTAELHVEPHDAPAKALRLIREIEKAGSLSPLKREELLERARMILGAKALVYFRRDASGEAVVLALAGALREGELDRMARRETQDGTSLLHASKNAGENFFLLARFNPGDTSRDAWSKEFLTYLAERLFGDESNVEPESVRERGGEVLKFPPGMVPGTSPVMLKLYEELRATVRSRLDVLLIGETGTGKELFARLIHDSGPTAGGPFVAVNCAAIPAELMEAELFGVLARVATGVDPRPGLFLEADGGTIFLDEIGDMPEKLQAKLLRVLQEREVLPVGGTTPKKIKVRVISSTHRDLEKMVREERFRADLFYRLRQLGFQIPPLRDRRGDIAGLVLHLVTRASQEHSKRIRGVSHRALSVLMNYDWLGNVRELQSVIDRAVLLCPSGGNLEAEHLPPLSRWHEELKSLQSPSPAPQARTADPRPLQEKIDELERAEILRVLSEVEGNKSKAAEILGISRYGLNLKLERLGLSRKNPRS